MRRPWIVGLAATLLASPLHAETCRWREPAGASPEAAQPIHIRVRGVDTVERGDPRWRASRAELQRRISAVHLAVLPHHRSYDRVVADVIVAGGNVGAAMDKDGWSNEGCARR